MPERERINLLKKGFGRKNGYTCGKKYLALAPKGHIRAESDYTGRNVGSAVIDSMTASHNARTSLGKVASFLWLALMIR